MGFLRGGQRTVETNPNRFFE